MSKCILDSSSLIAMLNSETGADMVESLLTHSIMSTINVAEVVAELDKKLSIAPEQSRVIILDVVNQIIPFDFDHAIEAGRLRKYTQKFGLSLGDRACIALALSTGYPVYTTDKIWSQLDLGCEVIVIR